LAAPDGFEPPNA